MLNNVDFRQLHLGHPEDRNVLEEPEQQCNGADGTGDTERPKAAMRSTKEPLRRERAATCTVSRDVLQSLRHCLFLLMVKYFVCPERCGGRVKPREAAKRTTHNTSVSLRVTPEHQDNHEKQRLRVIPKPTSEHFSLQNWSHHEGKRHF